MDRRVTSPKGVTSPTWGPPPPCKQALKRKKKSGAHCYEESVLVYFTWCRSGFERC